MSLRPLSQVFQIIFGIPLQYNAPMQHRSLFKALLTGFSFGQRRREAGIKTIPSPPASAANYQTPRHDKLFMRFF